MNRSITLFFFSVSLVSFGQGRVGPSNVIIPSSQPQSGVVDGVYEKKDVLAKKRAIPFEFVRENDYVWGKRTWSFIDLREKINHPLYYPLETISDRNPVYAQGRYSLYYILREALVRGTVIGYKDKSEGSILDSRSLTGGDAFTIPIKRDYTISDITKDNEYVKDLNSVIASSEKVSSQPTKKTLFINGDEKPIFHRKGFKTNIKEYVQGTNDETVIDWKSETLAPDSSETYLNPNTNTQEPFEVEFDIVKVDPYQPLQIYQYKLKEDWYFDKEKSELQVRIIGLAPVIWDANKNEEKILFWVYFPQVRDVLKNYYVYDAKSTVGGNTFDHLFMTRRFNAVVYKESTLYDRKIEDYRFGADALYESEKVKNTIRTFEHDVWNF
jgi:gliding motility associated protien GldN